MQIQFQNSPVKPLEGILDIIYIDLIGVYVNGKTSGIHNNKGGGKLCYMSILEQPSVYATQSGSTEFPLPKHPGATVTCPSGNVMEAIISATTIAQEENIRIWKQ